MGSLIEITDEYAKEKGNDLLSYLLNCVRQGRRSQIDVELNNFEQRHFTESIFKKEFSFTMMAIQFMWPQVFRAAVEGGLSELAASRVYRIYIKKAQQIRSVQLLMELHIQIFLDYADMVSRAKGDHQFSPLIRKCRLYIREHLYESLLVGNIALELNISKSHLSHLYKQETGETVSDFIRHEKIEVAKLLLQYSSNSLTEIGLKLGFCSQSYFTITFRKETKLTPRQYRENFLNK